MGRAPYLQEDWDGLLRFSYLEIFREIPLESSVALISGTLFKLPRSSGTAKAARSGYIKLHQVS